MSVNMNDFFLSYGFTQHILFDQPRQVAQYVDSTGSGTTFGNYYHTADASFMAPVDQYGQCSMGRDGLMDDGILPMTVLQCFGLNQCLSKPDCGGDPLYRCLE